MKKTKIICTMGPNTGNKELMLKLANSGMDIARFNFSHGDYEEHGERLKLLKEIREETGKNIGALLDTKGPEIRTGKLKDGQKITLKTGNKYILDINERIGDEQIGFVNYAGLIDDIRLGNHILIDDGLIELEVINICKEKGFIECNILNGGELGEKKGVNVPGISINLPALTDKDIEDIKFGIKCDFDFIAASFVRNAQAIYQIKDILKEAGANMMVIAKIENQEGIDNIDSIIEAADGIMVARGDMGVEIPTQEVPFIQKTIIKKCNIACKTVIIATQMLDSMIRNPRPTRAEVTDVANAVYDGTDVVMLSGETAMGKYPLEALQTMVKIVKETEKHLDHKSYRNRRTNAIARSNISNQVSYCAVSTADELHAKAIIAPSISGFTTKMLSKWRPGVLVYGLSPSRSTLRQMQIYWGVVPIESKRANTTDELVTNSIAKLKAQNHIKSGDTVIITAGIISNKAERKPAAHTNTMQVEIIE